MNGQDKFILERKTRVRYRVLRLKTGFYNIFHSKYYVLGIVGYIAFAIAVWRLLNLEYSNLSEVAMFNIKIFRILFPVYAVAGLIFVIIRMGTVRGAMAVNEDLWRIGLVNYAGEAPLLLRKYRENKEFNTIIMEFEPNGISIIEWQEKQERIETALNIHIIKIEQGINKRRILLHTVSGNSRFPKTICWDKKYLSNEDFTLVLGCSMTGNVSINLAKIPHMIIGGSTGSGKSVLLKLLIMQCVEKGAEIYIADFKGGVDFIPAWHRKCNIITDEKSLLEILITIINELEQRKEILRNSGYANINEYNNENTNKLKRIIFACDEIAEVLDKTGLSKESKELVSQIESKLAIIARQGRAFGIHLILATQRPDANILSGQIRNNIDFRVCGRADNILSQIILDNTEAADKISKESQGLFVTHDGVIFQGYLFDENNVFAE